MTRYMHASLSFAVSIGVALSAAACDDDISDQALVERARNAQTHESSSSEHSSSGGSESNATSSNDTPSHSASTSPESDTDTSEASPDAGGESTSEPSTRGESSDAGAPGDDLHEHVGFCSYGVRQSLTGGSSLISSLSGRIRTDGEGRVQTLTARTDFPKTESKLLSQQEILSYGPKEVEVVDHEAPRSAKHTRIELTPGHNLALLRQDTSGDGSYDKRALFVYGGAPTDVLISGTAYMLTKQLDSPRSGFEFEYDSRGRVVSARQTRGDHSGRTFEFTYEHGYFKRVVERDADGNQQTLWVVEFDDRGRPIKFKKKLDTSGDFNAIQSLEYDCDTSN